MKAPRHAKFAALATLLRARGRARAHHRRGRHLGEPSSQRPEPRLGQRPVLVFELVFSSPNVAPVDARLALAPVVFAARQFFDLLAPIEKAVLRNYINATIGFDELGTVTHKSPKSLMRMLGPDGNPQATNLFAIVAYLQKTKECA